MRTFAKIKPSGNFRIKSTIKVKQPAPFSSKKGLKELGHKTRTKHKKIYNKHIGGNNKLTTTESTVWIELRSGHFGSGTDHPSFVHRNVCVLTTAEPRVKIRSVSVLRRRFHCLDRAPELPFWKRSGPAKMAEQSTHTFHFTL